MALLIFFMISLAFAYPAFHKINNWGIHDWDQHFMLNAMPRETILEFKQFPLWSPHYCGGNVMLANPQSGFLSPLYIFVLIFGEVIGLKLLIIIYLISGLVGMFLLARHMNISLISSYLTAFLFMLSGLYAMHVSVGHTVWMQIAFMPYVFLFYLKSLENTRYVFLSALFMAFIFFGGGIYPLLFITLFLGFYAAIASIKELGKVKLKHLRNLVIILVLFIMLSSIKLIPMLEFAKGYSYAKLDSQNNDFKKMIESLTFRDVESRMGYMYDYRINGYTEEIWNWHEYHTYIGFLPLFLFLVGSVLLLRKEWPLILTAFIFFLIAWGNSSIVNIWGMLRQFPLISDLHGASRFLTVFIFSLALIIGKFTSIFENHENSPKANFQDAKKAFRFFVHKKLFFKFKSKKYDISRILLILLVLVIFIDLFLVNSQLFKHSFVVKPLKVERQEFAQVTGFKEKTQYPTFLANLGLVSCFEKVKPKLRAIPKFDTKTGAIYTNYIGEAYMLENNETQEITYFSPNKIKIRTNESGTLLLNQNYANGWKVENGEIKNVNGLIGAEAEKNQEIVFYYLPNSFVFGSVITIISLIFGIVLFLKFKTK